MWCVDRGRDGKYKQWHVGCLHIACETKPWNGYLYIPVAFFFKYCVYSIFGPTDGLIFD